MQVRMGWLQKDGENLHLLEKTWLLGMAVAVRCTARRISAAICCFLGCCNSLCRSPTHGGCPAQDAGGAGVWTTHGGCPECARCRQGRFADVYRIDRDKAVGQLLCVGPVVVEDARVANVDAVNAVLGRGRVRGCLLDAAQIYVVLHAGLFAMLELIAALKLTMQVCDVLVWPESAWLMPDGRSGVKLTALHVFLH